MTARSLLALTVAIALSGAAAATFAMEGTQDFPSADQLSSRSRAEVIAELDAARRDGTLEALRWGEASPAPQPLSTLSRAQVVAEAREALRLGLTGADEEGLRVPTPAQAELIRAAGLRALERQMAQAAN